MSQIRSWKYRLYPSKTQEKELNNYLVNCKEVWNSLLKYTKEKYEKTGKIPIRKELYLKTKGTSLFSQVAQNVADRINKSIKGMYSKRKAGLKAGFPRFKPIERVKSFTYPQFGFSLGNRLQLSKLGSINLRKHREIKGKIKTLTIKKAPSGKWFAVFTSEIEPPQGNPKGKPKAGIDLGIETFAYLSDGKTIQNPRHLKKAEVRLKEAHRNLSKKKKGSKNRKKAKHLLAVAYEKLTNRRTDFLHKASHLLANSYSLIAMENLNVNGMSKGFLAKPILDCAWADFARMLAYKAVTLCSECRMATGAFGTYAAQACAVTTMCQEEAGCEVVLVNPAGTTQECSQCNSVKRKTLAERWHSCACGASMHRDLNAAKNILARACSEGCKRSGQSPLRATAGTAECQACEEEASTPSIEGASIFNEAGSPAVLETKVSREETES